MFSVKATYRSETRKFSFQEHTFPTYEQLCSQVCRLVAAQHSLCLRRPSVVAAVQSVSHSERVLFVEDSLLS